MSSRECAGCDFLRRLGRPKVSSREKSWRKNLNKPLAISGMSAILLLAAVGTGVVATSQTVRDPENPGYAGNTIAASTSTGGRVVRDPGNPYWSGATLPAASAADDTSGP